MDSRLETVLHCVPAWLEHAGPQGDVVVASRVRLARNVSGIPFPHVMTGEACQGLCDKTEECIKDLFTDGYVLDPAELTPSEGEFLIERSLASRDLLEEERPTRILFAADGSQGLMVNEEDHFRAQGFAAGLDLEKALFLSREMITCLEQSFDLAYSARHGWLTSCPTNVGSGMRASLLLHLPALARQKSSLQKALQSARSAGLAVRGFHGEGSQALGNLYQISNQRTLGIPEEDQLRQVRQFGLEVTRFEQEVRTQILKDEASTRSLTSDIQSAYDILHTSARLTTSQALDALSMLRLAALGGLFGNLGVTFTSEQLLSQAFQLQPGHLQARIGSELDPITRDCSRAELLRKALGIKVA